MNEYLVRRQQPTAMDTDVDDTPEVDRMATDSDEILTGADDADNEPLPVVNVGSENWHRSFDQSWLPIIERDLARQRRQVR